MIKANEQVEVKSILQQEEKMEAHTVNDSESSMLEVE